MPPAVSAADFSRVSEEYRNTVVAEEEAKKRPSRPAGCVVATETPSTATVFESFFSALESEVVLPVSWFPEVPENHPIRQLDVHVLLWGGPDWKKFNELCGLSADAVKELGFANVTELLNWWILAVSTCTPAGKLLFAAYDSLPELALKYGGPKHTAVVESIISTAIEFNGLKREVANRDAKKPDTIDSSTSSNELSKPEDVPSETPQPPPQKN